ncbi:hypothetical protein DITRI_Ditri02bG0109900 [Diplodiscus trichospermus]
MRMKGLRKGETWMMTSGLKLILRWDPVRSDSSKKRIKQIVDQGIKKLQKSEANDGADDPDDQKLKPLRVERASVLSDICRQVEQSSK